MTAATTTELETRISGLKPTFDEARAQIARVLVGQSDMVDGLLIGLLSNGHVLLEGAPGLAKTTAVKALSQAFDLQFSRIQFTPDLLPADVVGTQVYEPKTGEFTTHLGPVFANLVLADEINRAPAKVQAALLEAMQERQVTLADVTHALPGPFLVLATQNPIDQEGTYPLPEAQTDRFLLKLLVDYPSKAEELDIVLRSTGGWEKPTPVASAEALLQAQALVQQIKLAEPLLHYIVDLVRATRAPGDLDRGLADLVAYGASPRASIALAGAARAQAFLQGRGYTLPEDVKAVALPVMRHRVLLSYEAEADNITTDEVLGRLLDKVEMP